MLGRFYFISYSRSFLKVFLRVHALDLVRALAGLFCFEHFCTGSSKYYENPAGGRVDWPIPVKPLRNEF